MKLKVLRNLFLLAVASLFVGHAAWAEERVTLTGEAIQGGIIIGTTEPGTKVILDGEPLMVSERGHFLFAFDRDHEGTVHLDLEYPDTERESLSIDVATREYDVQRIEGVASKYVSPSAEQLERIARDRNLNSSHANRPYAVFC